MSNPSSTSPREPDEVGADIGNVLFDTWLASRAVHALIDTAIEASGLDADEFAIYSTLAAGDGVTPTELAQWMAAPTTTVSSYVKRFERRGHVERVPNPDDRRSYRLQLTAAGRDAHRAAGELFAPTLAAVEEILGAQIPSTRQRLLALRRVVDTVSRTTNDETTVHVDSQHGRNGDQ